MKLFILKIKFNFGGRKDFLYPVVLQSHRELLLVDCGYEGFLPLIEAACSARGLSLSSFTGVVVTHHDIDHIGGLHELKSAYPHLTIYASATEAPYVDGSLKSLRLSQAEDMFECLGEEEKLGAIHFQHLLRNVKSVPVDVCLRECDVPKNLEAAGIQVIDTPGHMPGHISLYIEGSKTLIAADAVVIDNNELDLANPQFTLDLSEAIESVQKLSQLSIERMVCYHGGDVDGDVSARLSALALKYKHRS